MINLSRIIWVFIFPTFGIFVPPAKGEKGRIQSRFETCLNQGARSGKLGVDHRVSSLKEIGSLYDRSEIKKQIEQIIEMNPEEPQYQNAIENLSHNLNQASMVPATTKTAKNIKEIWTSSPTKYRRAPSAINSREECIEKEDKVFDQYWRFLKKIIEHEFSHGIFEKIITNIDSVAISPAGDKNLFAAFARRKRDGSSQVCLNPEEAPPLQIPKVIHELTHANDTEVGQYEIQFNEKQALYQPFSKRLKKAFDALEDYDKHIDRPLMGKIGSKHIINHIDLDKELSVKGVKKLLRGQLGKINLGKFKKYSLDKHAFLVWSWASFYRTTEVLYAEIIEDRYQLDTYKFLGEIKAYANEYDAAVQLVDSDPSFFCKLWVPSYSHKRPVRFFEAYLENEGRLLKGEFPRWIADIYTFKTKRYLPESLFIEGKKKKGLRKDIQDMARNTLDSALNLRDIPLSQ